MNQEYKPKYEQMRDNQPGKIEGVVDERFYANNGHSRNVGFTLSNGDGEAFNYSYLVRLRYVGDESAIYLVYTFCTVKIEGYNLKGLFLELFDQRNRFIECIDERYMELSDNQSTVTRVTILENK